MDRSGFVDAHGLQERVGVADGGDDLVTGGVEEACESFVEQDGRQTDRADDRRLPGSTGSLARV
ncbi:hypothetical protein AB0L44_44715 [Nonomuraea wenchangensis]|uniref:hypothetical protein n=1 Tax=Nonomuraea wenchangensis TaxID=568860 RepID=UPI0034489BFB